jgi:hypothetical protein
MRFRSLLSGRYELVSSAVCLALDRSKSSHRSGGLRRIPARRFGSGFVERSPTFPVPARQLHENWFRGRRYRKGWPPSPSSLYLAGEFSNNVPATVRALGRIGRFVGSPDRSDDIVATSTARWCRTIGRRRPRVRLSSAMVRSCRSRAGGSGCRFWRLACQSGDIPGHRPSIRKVRRYYTSSYNCGLDC